MDTDGDGRMKITRALKYAATPICEYSVYCDECGNHETLFEHYGWCTVKGKKLCPKCAEEASDHV